MGDCCARSVVALVLLTLLAGIGGIACGCVGSYWFTTSILDSHVGLWKRCSDAIPDGCIERSNLFEFEDKDEAFVGVKSLAFDLVFLLLIVAGGMSIFALITTFSMCCAGRERWRCAATGLTILTLFAAGSAVVAIVLSELLIRREMPENQINIYEHGWSAILAWIGAGSLCLSFVFSLITCCVIPEKNNRSKRRAAYDEAGFKYTPNSRQQTYQAMSGRGNDSMGNSNPGYQLQ